MAAGRPPSTRSWRSSRLLQAAGAVLFFGGILAVALPGVARPSVVALGFAAVAAGVVVAVIARRP